MSISISLLAALEGVEVTGALDRRPRPVRRRVGGGGDQGEPTRRPLIRRPTDPAPDLASTQSTRRPSSSVQIAIAVSRSIASS